MEVNYVYTSIACNDNTNILDWGKNGLVAYGAKHGIAIMDPKNDGSCKIIQFLVQNTSDVTCIQWIKNLRNQNEYEIICGYDDGTAVIWNIENLVKPTYHILPVKSSSTINAVDAFYEDDGFQLIATASSDIKLWKFKPEKHEYEILETISLKNEICFTLKLTTLSTTNQLLLVYAGSDYKINIFTEIRKDVEGNQNNKRNLVATHEILAHDGWVRSIDFLKINDHELLLASGSHDSNIKLWKISLSSSINCRKELWAEDFHYDSELEIRNLLEGFNTFTVTSESILTCHTNTVYGVHLNKVDDKIQLLSVSLDRTIIIWSPNEEGIWFESSVFGKVGGSSGGYFGGKFASNGKSIIAYSYEGGLHMWERSKENESEWNPKPIITGHFGSVTDLNWEPNGQFLITVSEDKTTRIHAPCIVNNRIMWHEIARPQVHGYEIACIAMLSRYRFVSGAGEKIIRTFQATSNFIENFRRLCKIEFDKEGDELLGILPKGASVPSLGLSNKAIYTNQQQDTVSVHTKYSENESEEDFIPIELFSPPFETTLMHKTLWPETQKLYGHGDIIMALCVSSDGRFLASSCKATTIEDAAIIIWDTTTWEKIQVLIGHSLTVVHMKFSPNNRYLLSVSRSREWIIFENDNSLLVNYKIIARNNKTHRRIIWSCDWASDSNLFCTASRDGKVAMWSIKSIIENEECIPLDVLTLPNAASATAITIHPDYKKCNNTETGNKEYLVAVGLEKGQILVFKFIIDKWIQIDEIKNAHSGMIRKLQFRPCFPSIQLASCGTDHLVRIYELGFKDEGITKLNDNE